MVYLSCGTTSHTAQLNPLTFAFFVRKREREGEGWRERKREREKERETRQRERERETRETTERERERERGKIGRGGGGSKWVDLAVVNAKGLDGLVVRHAPPEQVIGGCLLHATSTTSDLKICTLVGSPRGA